MLRALLFLALLVAGYVAALDNGIFSSYDAFSLRVRRQLISVSSSHDNGGPQKHTKVNFLGAPLADINTDDTRGGRTKRQLISVSSSRDGSAGKHTKVNFLGASLADINTDDGGSSSTGQHFSSASNARPKRQLISVSSTHDGSSAGKHTRVNFLGAPLANIETDSASARQHQATERVRRSEIDEEAVRTSLFGKENRHVHCNLNFIE
ncbi:hypothetical protein AAVH_07525 [Aphelenchoides avenae]|nr:hypothetical protein AAVH_07525 [Aphelenchus avenae]